MSTHRVIFPDPDFWTRKKETTMTTPNNDVPPIRAVPEKAAVLVCSYDDQNLHLGIRFDLPPPMGRVDVMLGHELATTLASDLTELLALGAEERAELLARLIEANP